MKKILLVMDTPERDLKGIALTAHYLASRQAYFPVVTTTKNEVSGLIKHRPELILVPHVRYERHQGLLELAAAQGTRVGVLPVEGYPGKEELVGRTVVGFERFHPFVDLVLTWGESVQELCERQPSLAHARIRSVGCPRFDFLIPPCRQLAPAKEELCRRYGLAPERPLLTWFSSCKYANPPEGHEAWLRNIQAPDSSGRIIAGVVDLAAKGRDHQRVFDALMAAFERLARDFPRMNLLVKPHPGEPRAPFGDRLADLPNVRVVEPSEQSTDLVVCTDIQLNWRCMTSAEAWMRDLQSKVISMEPPGLEMADFAGLTVGNDLVRSYDELRAAVAGYLDGGAVSPSLVAARRDFIRRFLHSNEGSAAERCAEEVHRFLSGKSPARRSLKAYRRILPYLPGRVRKGHWLLAKRRPGEHKYFPPSAFHDWMRAVDQARGVRVPEDRYLLEV